QLMDSLVRRMGEMLSINKVAVFIEDEFLPTGFRLAHAAGLDRAVVLPSTIRETIRARSFGQGFVTRTDLIEADGGRQDGHVHEERLDTTGTRTGDLSNVTQISSELHYYVPCIVRDRMVAIIAVGRTSTGAMLTSEDTDLLRALSGYVAVAI